MTNVIFDEWVAVVSTVIDCMATSGKDLYVLFKTTKQWFRVEGAADRFNEMRYADSINGWYHRNIKGQYPVFKLETVSDMEVFETGEAERGLAVTKEIRC